MIKDNWIAVFVLPFSVSMSTELNAGKIPDYQNKNGVSSTSSTCNTRATNNTSGACSTSHGLEQTANKP